MPHSSSGFGEVNINRIYLVEHEIAKESNDRKMSLEGQESSPPASVALVRYLHGQIVSLQDGKLVPVIFRDKAVRNGYYLVGTTNSSLTDNQGETILADWTIELERLGSDTDIDIQSRLTGAVRQNDFSLAGTRWHAPSLGHYGYNTGSTNPSSTVTRVGEDGSHIVYLTVPASIAPRWGCAVASYKVGRVRIKDTSEVASENEMEGINRNISASGWSLGNGLVNVSPSVTAGVLNVQIYDSGAYRDKLWNVQAVGANVPAWSSATILRNDFEMCVIRLVATQTTAGRTQLDLTLRRGSRFVEGYMQSTTSTTLSVHLRTLETNASTSASGYNVVTSNDADGNKSTCGTSRSFTTHANGGITKTSTLFLDFYLGSVKDGTTAAAGDTAIELRNQYIGSMPEITYAVKR